MESVQIGQRCVDVGGLVWLPEQATEKGNGVYVPKLFQVRSVGSRSVHLKGRDDELIAYCYLTDTDCLERCRDLFTIYTMRPREQYPG